MRPCFPLLLFATLWLLPGPVPASEVGAARQAELTTLLYQDCGSCHGMTLKGGLGPALPAVRMRQFGREALARVILDGIPGTAMPGWAPLLSDADARWLADQLQRDDRSQARQQD